MISHCSILLLFSADLYATSIAAHYGGSGECYISSFGKYIMYLNWLYYNVINVYRIIFYYKQIYLLVYIAMYTNSYSSYYMSNIMSNYNCMIWMFMHVYKYYTNYHGEYICN